MVVRRLLILLALGLDVGAVCANAGPGPAVVLTREEDCFRFDTYEKWNEFIRARQSGSAAPAIPKETYDGYRESIDCTFFTYTVDGVEVAGFSARPREAAGQPLPAIIYNRGGNGRLGQVTFAGMLAEIFPLASRGFFVLGSQYREAEEFGGRDIDDVLALLTLIDRRPDVMGDRIGMMGRSRGGIMTMLAGTRSARIKAMILVGTPTDLLADLRARPDMESVYARRIPNYAADKEAALRERSPLFVADRLVTNAPILILHGTADERARTANALQLAMKLQELKRPYKLVVYPGGDHSLRTFDAEVRKEISLWFESHLGSRPPD
jgi:dipeptidyl aminopeptidase/acylaminoacyl peptidase